MRILRRADCRSSVVPSGGAADSGSGPRPGPGSDGNLRPAPTSTAGATPGAVNFCYHCGQPIQPGAAVCVHCGFAAPNMTPTVYGGDRKSKWVAVLLCAFLGCLGIHNFYLGRTGVAISQLLICLLGSCVYVGPVIVFVWTIVELILLLTDKLHDGQGRPLKDSF